MGISISMKGNKTLEKTLKKLSNADRLLDPTVARAARGFLRNVATSTPKKTGTTSRGWQTPKKLGLSKYQIANDTKTADKKHSLITILDEGRGPVVPVRAPLLFIPLSERGRARASGLKFGTDFVLAKKAKAYKGTGFLQKALKTGIADLEAKIIQVLKDIQRER